MTIKERRGGGGGCLGAQHGMKCKAIVWLHFNSEKSLSNIWTRYKVSILVN